MGYQSLGLARADEAQGSPGCARAARLRGFARERRKRPRLSAKPPRNLRLSEKDGSGSVLVSNWGSGWGSEKACCRRCRSGMCFYASRIDRLLTTHSSLVDLVEAVRALPYGRPSDRTVEGMLREHRGTCSTKHLFLARTLAVRFPETAPLIIHRVYRLDRARARELFGRAVADVLPEDGLVDVHRYLTILVEGRRITVDATFPGAPWDGHSGLTLACGPGPDYPAGESPDADKRRLEDEFCDPVIREPFIAALAETSHSVPSGR
jgi:hypothetical protein